MYLLLMDPFGSDTRQYDMHYKCHSTSICRFGVHFSLPGHCLQLLKALWGGQHRRPSISDPQVDSGWRNKACNSKSAIPARRHGFNGFNGFNGVSGLNGSRMKIPWRHVYDISCRQWQPYIFVRCDFREQGHSGVPLGGHRDLCRWFRVHVHAELAAIP